MKGLEQSEQRLIHAAFQQLGNGHNALGLALSVHVADYREVPHQDQELWCVGAIPVTDWLPQHV